MSDEFTSHFTKTKLDFSAQISGEWVNLNSNIQAIETHFPSMSNSLGGGCLIATATYGTELAPQVQQLRELRDTKLLSTHSGTAFVSIFNAFYYSFSPQIADFERENPIFKEGVKLAIIPMISSLSVLNYVNLDSEGEVLGYGISLILLNLGMYCATPIIIIIKLKQRMLV